MTAGGRVWTLVGQQSAAQRSMYCAAVPTTSDSMPDGTGREVFRVRAVSIDGMSWESAADSGFSVDNIPPERPQNLRGQFDGKAAKLQWNRNRESDLGGYRVYRALCIDCVPYGESIVATGDTVATDSTRSRYWYQVTAVDAHGNESDRAVALPESIAAGGSGDENVWLDELVPNPSRGEVMVHFNIPRRSFVEIYVCDIQGRRVMWMLREECGAGEQRRVFVLGSRGRWQPGIYEVIMRSCGVTAQRRMAAIF
jgi:hypothetical protein